MTETKTSYATCPLCEATCGLEIVTSRAGMVEIPIELTDAIMPGVVSIPHGWGHRLKGTSMSIASEHAGVNTNILTDEGEVDPLSGNAVLNGVPVTIGRATII